MSSEAHRIAEYCAGKPLSSRHQYRVPCPSHGGRDNNLVITEGRSGRTVFQCHSHGCSFSEIREAIPSDIWDTTVHSTSIWSPRPLPPTPVTFSVREEDRSDYTDFGLEMWKAAECRPETDHAYAVKKHFGLGTYCREAVMPRRHAMIEKGERVLVIRMTDEDGCFVGSQLINEKGDKAFAGNAGMLIMQGVHAVTSETTFHVVEGFATGTAIPLIFPKESDVTVVAFSKSALAKTAQLMRERFSKRVLTHHEVENIDMWDVVYDLEKRQRWAELHGEAA